MPTETPFDLKTATALVHPYDGSPATLDAFVDSVNLLAELTTAAHVAVAVKFVKTRLSGRARSALPDTITTFKEVTDAVKQHCEGTESTESVAAKLKSLKINGDLEKYLQNVEQLTGKLTSMFIKSSIPLAVATKMATKIGVDSLISQASDSETRILMKAAEFSSIQVAIQKFNEATCAPSAQILSTQFRKLNSNRGYSARGNFNNRFGYRNSNNRQNNNFQQFQNGNQFQPRPFNQRTNFRGSYHHGRGNYLNQNRGHFQFQNNHQGNARIFFTPAQMPPQNMQQLQENTQMMTHGIMSPIMPPGINTPQGQSHPLGGTQGQYIQ